MAGVDGEVERELHWNASWSGAISRVQKKTKSERWNYDMVNAVQGSVQCPDPAVQGQSAVPIRVHIDVQEVPGEPRVLEKETKARDVYLRKSDFEKHGYTTGCPGCLRLRVDGAPKLHTKACKDRIKEELKKTPEGRGRLEQAYDRQTTRIIEESTEQEDKKKEEEAARHGGHSGMVSGTPVEVRAEPQRREERVQEESKQGEPAKPEEQGSSSSHLDESKESPVVGAEENNAVKRDD